MRAPEFWQSGGLVAEVLRPFGFLYGAITTSRANQPAKTSVPVPVICVGNAVLGGSGKTPVCLDLANRMIAQGTKPHALSRGYGGEVEGPVQVDPIRHSASEVGDEPLLLAAVLPTWIGQDRGETAALACKAGADLLIMDDGLQNPGLKKDLNFLVVDALAGLGNGYVFPAGPLREPWGDALLRADAVISIGGTPPACGDMPVFRCDIAPDTSKDWRGKRVVAFAGIGRPEKFFTTLREMGAYICETAAFADHHAYSPAEIEKLRARALGHDAHLVTTSKDWVRLPVDTQDAVTALPVRLTWQDEAALDTFLAARLSSTG